jgi:hypothetical protein
MMTESLQNFMTRSWRQTLTINDNVDRSEKKSICFVIGQLANNDVACYAYIVDTGSFARSCQFVVNSIVKMLRNANVAVLLLLLLLLLYFDTTIIRLCGGGCALKRLRFGFSSLARHNYDECDQTDNQKQCGNATNNSTNQLGVDHCRLRGGHDNRDSRHGTHVIRARQARCC